MLCVEMGFMIQLTKNIVKTVSPTACAILLFPILPNHVTVFPLTNNRYYPILFTIKKIYEEIYFLQFTMSHGRCYPKKKGVINFDFS